jgi:peptidoglycan/xylan/chitin deacetylase (PgdA/CDA1 family)
VRPDGGAVAFASLLLTVLPLGSAADRIGDTEIAKWPHGKRAAVSLTYDDGSINQFRVAVPIMKELRLPATFFIITGDVAGSRWHGTFIGRPPEAIIRETADVPTGQDNLFERAAAIAYLDYEGTRAYHERAGDLYEDGKRDEAYRAIDEGYAKVRSGGFAKQREPGESEAGRRALTWDELRALAKQGHEIASHTVTHPRLAVLDEPNLVYELEKSRQEILDQLGAKHTFSVECPYGTEDERAVGYALARYPAARNRMPEPFLEELNRWNDMDPGASRKEYVQWQRGALTRTPMASMKSWIDTIAAHDNVWLVLVFHGVDGIGWEPKTSGELKEYFQYIKSRQSRLWVAPFQDVTKYMREREHSQVHGARKGNAIEVVLRHDLDESLYDLPLTLKTYVPSEWSAVAARQGTSVQRLEAVRERGRASVTYQAVPNAGAVTLANTGP